MLKLKQAVLVMNDEAREVKLLTLLWIKNPSPHKNSPKVSTRAHIPPWHLDMEL